MKKENILLLLSELAYKRNSRIKDETIKAGLGVAIIRKVKKLKYIIVKYDKQIYIAIRGSANKNNWMTNFIFWKKKTIYGKIPFGFYKAARLIYNDISKAVTSSYEGKINISGHSLGAALAFLVAMMLERERGLDVDNVRSYAKPYTGKITYKFKFNYIKFYNNLDGIYFTNLWNKRTLKNSVYISDNGKKYVEPSKEFIKLDRLKTIEKNRGKKELFKDHEILYYRQLLWEN